MFETRGCEEQKKEKTGNFEVEEKGTEEDVSNAAKLFIFSSYIPPIITKTTPPRHTLRSQCTEWTARHIWITHRILNTIITNFSPRHILWNTISIQRLSHCPPLKINKNRHIIFLRTQKILWSHSLFQETFFFYLLSRCIEAWEIKFPLVLTLIVSLTMPLISLLGSLCKTSFLTNFRTLVTHSPICIAISEFDGFIFTFFKCSSRISFTHLDVCPTYLKPQASKTTLCWHGTDRSRFAFWQTLTRLKRSQTV